MPDTSVRRVALAEEDGHPAGALAGLGRLHRDPDGVAGDFTDVMTARVVAWKPATRMLGHGIPVGEIA